VDTNLVVRVLTKDDPDQARRAATLLSGGPILVPTTVVLETEWVLRHAYGLGRDTIAGGLRALLGLPEVVAEAPDTLARALAWYDQGVDLADALHLSAARSKGAEKFATFDQAFLGRAASLTEIDLIEP
jgi:predicted nucleic-acid-binding protein